MSWAPKRALTLCIIGLAAVAGNGARDDAPPEQPPAHASRPVVARAFGPIHPRLSAAGDQVAFSYQGAIWRAPRSGGEMTRLTDGEGFDVTPVWSPDGARIAHASGPGFFGGALRIVNSDDGSPVPLPAEVTSLEKLEFSPDGGRLLGKFRGQVQGPALAWFDINSGELAPVPTGALSPHRYALSGDGRRIAFTTTQDVPGQQGGNDGPEADLWLVPDSGGEPTKLVQFPARIHDLCWGPGDRGLIVATDLGGVHNDLWKVPLDDPDRGARRITSGQADEDSPSVSSDGRWLLYTDNHEGATSLVAWDLGTGREERLEMTSLNFRRPTGHLSMGVTDGPGGPQVVARVSIRHEGGKHHSPPGSLYRLHKGDLHFYANGGADLELPEGRYQAKASRGPEYGVSRLEFEVRPGETTRITASPTRWVDQRARGWHSGESHIHANYGYGHWYNSPRTMFLQCAGEDLGVSNFMVANSDGDGIFDREYFRGRPDPLSDGATSLYWNEEFRSTIWGHMTLLNLRHLVEPISTGFLNTTRPYDSPTNADVADLAHDQGGHANYTHPAQNVDDPYLGAYTAKALPMDVALGRIDSLDVMGTNHEAAFPLWYRLLNCGFRLPASAGTDCFLNRIPSKLPGSDRAYVRVDGDFSYEEWARGLKAGRTFVTNGPMLELTIEGKGPGETVIVGAGGGVRARGRVISQYPLDRLELIQNGKVVATARATGGRLSAEIDLPVEVSRSGWIALRATGPSGPDQPGGSTFAHSSALYVEVPGRPIESSEDAEFFIDWIDRLATDVRRRDRVPARSRSHVESQLAEARAVYEKLVIQP